MVCICERMTHNYFISNSKLGTVSGNEKQFLDQSALMEEKFKMAVMRGGWPVGNLIRHTVCRYHFELYVCSRDICLL